MTNNPYLSIVTPTFNEEDTIQVCLEKVAEVMKHYEGIIEYEHIVIDNASSDRTTELAVAFSLKDPHVRVAVNDRNVGGALNVYRGLKLTRGDWVVPMLPADLQDPAEVLPLFLSEVDSKTNVVFGIRKIREEGILMRSLRAIFYRMIRKFSSVDIPLQSGDFCLINRVMVDALVDAKDENPYLRGLIAQLARSPKFVGYTWGRRLSGKSKASPLVLAEVAVSGIVSTTQLPARVALLLGFLVSVGSLIWTAIQVILVLGFGQSAAPGIATITVALFFFGGIQLFFTGLIGEYILSIHKQVKKAPEFQTKFISNI